MYSAYFMLFLGYFRVISTIRPPLLDLGPPLFTYPGSAPATHIPPARWGIRFPRNAPDKFLQKLCKLGTYRHLTRPKFSMRNFRPSPTHILNIIKVGHTVPEICSGQNNMDGGRRTPHAAQTLNY